MKRVSNQAAGVGAHCGPAVFFAASGLSASRRMHSSRSGPVSLDAGQSAPTRNAPRVRAWDCSKATKSIPCKYFQSQYCYNKCFSFSLLLSSLEFLQCGDFCYPKATYQCFGVILIPWVVGDAGASEGRYKATWKSKFKLPWRKAGLPKLSR